MANTETRKIKIRVANDASATLERSKFAQIHRSLGDWHTFALVCEDQPTRWFDSFAKAIETAQAERYLLT